MTIDTLMCDILKTDKLYDIIQIGRKMSEHYNLNMSSSDELLRSNQKGMDFCYQILSLTSRSFSFVIQRLAEPLRDTICIYYLMIRGLDTIEDDMENKDSDRKVDLLENFHRIIDNDPKFHTSEFGIGDEKVLLENFAIVTKEYRKLGEAYKKIIRRTTEKMGGCMAHYCASQNHSSNSYRPRVAEILGDGLSQLFVIYGIENKKDLDGLQEEINSIKIFLQKTDSIKKFSLNFTDKMACWPEEIWSKHGPSLAWFHEHPDNPKSVDCLNEMVCDALAHLPQVLHFISRLSDPAVFRFCAVPPLMALSYLRHFFGDPAVFCRQLKVAPSFKYLIFARADCFADFRCIAGSTARKLSFKVAAALAQMGAEGAGAKGAGVEATLRAALETILAVQRDGPLECGPELPFVELANLQVPYKVMKFLVAGCYKAAG